MDKKAKAIFYLLVIGILLSGVHSQENGTANPGYITAINLSTLQDSTYWQGYYGEVVVGGLSGSNSATAPGGEIAELDLYFPSNCSISSITGEVYASRSSSILWASMAAGTTSEVDDYLDLGALDLESGTSTFTANRLYNVAGSNINAPATYTFVDGTTSLIFDTGVLNDSVNTVFVSRLQQDLEGFENENITHDFQIMLPVDPGTNPVYYFSGEFDVVCALFDLMINSSGLTYAQNPVEGNPVTVSATVHNLEEGSYQGFTVSFYVDGSPEDSNTLSIGSFGSETTQFTWTAVSGDHNLSIRLDPLGEIIETNESNNEAWGQISVTSLNPPQDKDMDVDADGQCVGESASIEVTSEGQGVDGADVDIYFDGSRVESLSTNSGGDTSFTPDEAGTYEIYASRSGYTDAETELDIIVCESCSDGVLNQDETDIDCGGICSSCADGDSCVLDSDCLSGWCHEGVCEAPTCSDGILNQDETDIDCGGVCGPCESCSDGVLNQDESDIDCGGVCSSCPDGDSCVLDSDCLSGWCHGGVCETPSCVDGVRNQDETDVDCGGVCLPCGEGESCEFDLDCDTGICLNGTCAAESCSDGILNQDESDIDCGGVCGPCAEGGACVLDSDCLSGWCHGGVCMTPSCSDGVLNQDESDIDCGGSCSPCADDMNCSFDTDCVGGWCLAGICFTPSCLDGVMNQDETSIDCGGICPGCTEGETCSVDSDCLSGWCNNGSCGIPSCFDGFQNQDEEGIDCGGGCLPCHCVNGQKDANESGIDCGGECTPCGCFNGVMDGGESDVDCGGECSPCWEGNSCSLNSDCQSNWCFEGSCKASSCRDGIRGPGEDGIDCGGPCTPCHCFNEVWDADEEGVDCGGSCPACRFIRIVTNETDTGETMVLTYNSTSMCLNNFLDKGETDIDCGGKCPPCVKGKVCISNSDCRSGFCSEGVCVVSTCSDGLTGPREEKIDCGGPCRSCPWIKFDEKAYVGENMSIVIINPWQGLSFSIKEPGGSSFNSSIDDPGKNTYYVVEYTPNNTGMYYMVLEGYDERYVKIRERSIIPLLDEVPDEVQSLFIPFVFFIIFVYWLRNRRWKVVVDETSLKKFAEEDLLYWGLVKKYLVVYTPADIQKELLGIKELVFLELSDQEIDEAEDLADRSGIFVEAAKALILSKKIKAKKCIIGTDIPEDFERKFNGTHIVSFDSEFKLMKAKL